MTIRERIKQVFPLRSYGVKDDMGTVFFIEARSVSVKNGRLLFKSRWRLVAAVDAGKWQRVLEGLSLEDFEK